MRREDRPVCPKCEFPMQLSEDGISYYCPKCYEYVSRSDSDIEAEYERRFGA